MQNYKTSTIEEYDTVILGAGPVGITAGIQARHKNQSAIVCTHFAANEIPVEIPKRFEQSFSQDAQQQFYNYWMQEIFVNALEIKFGTQITRIYKSNEYFLISLQSGDKIICKSLVVASENYSLADINNLLTPSHFKSGIDCTVIKDNGETYIDGLYMVGESIGQISTISAMNKSIMSIDDIALKTSRQNESKPKRLAGFGA
jgi:hypothetical protein